MKRKFLLVGIGVLVCSAVLAADRSPDPSKRNGKDAPTVTKLVETSKAMNQRMTALEMRIKQLEKQLADKTNPFGKSKARDQAVAKKLAEPLPINFEANKLVNVLDYFRNTIGCNMYVDWRRLEQVSIEQDVPITMQLNNISAAHALKLVLLQGSVKTGEKTAAFQIVDGVIYISTRKGLKHLTQ